MKSPDEVSFLDRLLDPLHLLGLNVRRLLKWKKGPPPTLPHESKQHLFSYLEGNQRREAELREEELCKRYQLNPLKERSLRRVYCENLYLLDELEKIFALGCAVNKSQNEGFTTIAIDIGCRNWDYVFAQERFLQKHFPSVELHGIEIDAFGIYRDFHSRFDYAQAFIRQTGNRHILYHPMDFLKFPLNEVNLVFLFYPFITKWAQLKWGLPLKFWGPQTFLQKVSRTLAEGGILVVFNQTKYEHELLLEYLRQEPLKLINSGPMSSVLVPFHERAQDRWSGMFMKILRNSGRKSPSKRSRRLPMAFPS